MACQHVAASESVAGTALILMARDVFFRLAYVGVCLPEALLCRERTLVGTLGCVLSHAHLLLKKP